LEMCKMKILGIPNLATHFESGSCYPSQTFL
jgi:hypothetical protein